MKKIFLLVSFICIAIVASSQTFSYADAWGKAGFNLQHSKSTSVEVIYSVPSFTLENFPVDGHPLEAINLPGAFLFNDEGMPNLPGQGRYIAIPQGAVPHLNIISQRTVTIPNVEMAPAPNIPPENDDRPLRYVKNQLVYSSNAFYPAKPIQLSRVQKIRGVDVVMLGITPFQYNPVTKDLVVTRDIKVEISFTGGNGHFGDDAYRGPGWDPIISDAILNSSSLPVIDYNKRFQSYSKKTISNECQYIIITPTGGDFVRWADSIANFRNQQGILTHVFKVSDIGGNTADAIENWVDEAYNTWTIKPEAVLLLGDFGPDATMNIMAPLVTYESETFPSDNKYADVDGDDMPDLIFSRLVANNNEQLTILCSKFLNYERNPPTDTSFYQHPITALGWQTERWFQLCSEVVGGYFKSKGKHPVRINEIYQGTPDVSWSSAPNTSQVVGYFGPSGTGYIPASPDQMPCCWSGGTAADINAAINDGAFILQHRDHGNVDLWGEPSYGNSNIDQLTNTKLPFVMSINCLTGKYNSSTDCLAERFIRLYNNGHNAGALGVIAPSEVSYSFVNDTFVWGMYDNMWPDFMPSYGTNPASRGECPAFAMAAGKYFLQQSNWPYNTGDKQITYYLFHTHADAYLRLFSEVPQNLTVTHDPQIPEGTTTFTITANADADIALTVNNEIIATGTGSSTGPVDIIIPPQVKGAQILVTVTKQNYFRYSSTVLVVSGNLGANFTVDAPQICVGSSANFTDLSTGSPTSWAWTFEGGTPASSSVQNPPQIVYSTAGNYSVTLTVTNGPDSKDTTKTAYIHVYNPPTADFQATSVCAGNTTEFTDLSSANGGTITSREWNFGDGSSTVFAQNPTHIYTNPGIYNVSLKTTSNETCSNQVTKTVVSLMLPVAPATPTGPGSICQGSAANTYTTTGAGYATSYSWEIIPAEAGTFNAQKSTTTLDCSPTFSGPAVIQVKGSNDCGESPASQTFSVSISPLPAEPVKPQGPDSVDSYKNISSVFTTTGASDAASYEWFVSPAAGTITGIDLTGTVTWNNTYKGAASVTVKGKNACGDGIMSIEKSVTVISTLGISELPGVGLEIFPNPTSGKFTLELTGNNTLVNITIFNALGVPVVTETNIKVMGKLTRNLDFSKMSAGIYSIRVEGDNGMIIRKILIQK